jgi:uncharacterized protein (UPF0332 family)
MSGLINKHELNINAAKFLCDNGHYATVLHPAYYSCLQLIKYKINHVLKINYKQQEVETSRDYRGNTHAYLISKIVEEIRRRKGNSEAYKFHNQIKKMKKLRESSDYKNEQPLSRDTCEKAIQDATELILIIKRILQ